MAEKKFYITTPIYYPNAEPHLGHAYSTLLADVLTRYHDLMGYETYFMTGTDENTQKVIHAAEKLGEDPKVYLEKIVERFKFVYKELGISYSQFLRTSDPKVHWPGVIEMWNRFEKNDDLYKGTYQGLYCVGCEGFKKEKDLVEDVCPDHGTVPEQLSEENYFFRLSKYTEEIKNLIKKGELKIEPETRKKEILSFLEEGLEDVSFSRPAKNVPWGIPVPGDDTQRMYVWMDALTNYVTGLGFGRDEENMRFWPGVHLVGKDILRFHAAIWPAMLLSVGLPLPKKIHVHGMIISNGKKMSKSLGNSINPMDMVERYGREATRYLLLRHVHPFEDTDVTWERLDEWYTAGLANGLGNLVSRVMKMAEDNLDGPVERPEASPFLEAYTNAFDEYRFDEVLNVVWKRIGELDEQIAEEVPFKVVKEDPEKGKKMIAALAVELYGIGRLLNPILPETSAVIKEAVLQNKKPETLFARLDS